jgi:hypothetical protein
MKINSITTNTGYLSSRVKNHASGRECVQQNLKQNNNEQINTTIKSNSDGRASFKGGAPFIHKAANFASDNPLVAEALFAILITCGLRPLTIMATAKTEEDKEKCSYQAAKSISSGLVGLATTALIGMPIAAASKAANKNGAFNMPENMKQQLSESVQQGVGKLKEVATNLTQEGNTSELASTITSLTEGGKINLGIFKKMGKGAEKEFKNKISEVAPDAAETIKKAMSDQQVLNNYARTGKNVIDKLFQPIFMPIRATVTIALVPILLGLVGKQKPQSKPKQEETKQTAENKQPDKAETQNAKQKSFETLNYNVFKTTNEKEIFQTFAGVANYENK